MAENAARGRPLAREFALRNRRQGTYPLHAAAEFGQAAAAGVLLDYGADVSLLDTENDAIALGWAAFFGRPEVVAVLLRAGSEPSQRNKHGLTPLGCAVGGTDKMLFLIRLLLLALNPLTFRFARTLRRAASNAA